MSKKKSTQSERAETPEASKASKRENTALEKEQTKNAPQNDRASEKQASQKQAENDREAEQPNWQTRCIELEAENQELKETLLRKQADFENYRRRMQKEKEEAIQFANRSLIGELLEVLDNFERALTSHRDEEESSATAKTLFEGLELVEKQLSDILSSRWGLKPIDSVGQEFDPNLHEALMMEENSEYQVATVVEDFQTGYILHERVLRPARVKVAKPES